MTYSLKQERHWREQIDKCASSGLRPAEYCRLHRLSAKSFYKWRCRLSQRRGQETLSLLPVLSGDRAAAPAPSPAGSGVSLEAGGLRIQLEAGFDGETLERVLRIAGALPC